MPFAATTLDRVMGVLGLPVTRYYVELVQAALDEADIYGGAPTVARIEGYLSQYAAQELALNSDAANAGLIQADVLHWSAGGKTSGVKAEMSRLRGLISKSLLLDSLTAANKVRLVRDCGRGGM